LIPTYTKIKVPNTSPAHKYTRQKIPNLRIKDEIKYLHVKKQNLNQKIYHLYVNLANAWDKTWPYIQHTNEEKLQKEAQTKCKTLDKKLRKLTLTQTVTPKVKHTFHPRVVNNTDISFTNSETALLQKVLKYNIHAKKKNWLKDVALEAETAITQLPFNERDVYRKLVADRIDTLQRQNSSNPTRNTHPESKLIKSIQSKLQNNNTMITRADKGNSLVILPITQYESKMQDFLLENNFQKTTTDPTKAFQTQIRKTIKDSKTLIAQDNKWKYINLNPSAPSIKGLIKVHKPDQPIRPIVNWCQTPAYKLFTNNINHTTPLPNSFNIINTKELTQDFKDTPWLPHFTFASLDLYPNIPVK
jgi:hypothetical protein